MEPISFIFLLGAVARMVVVEFFVLKIKEIKHKQKFKGLKEFEHSIIKEFKLTLIEGLHKIEPIKNYIKE